MTSLTDIEISKQFPITKEELFSYYKKHGLPRTARSKRIATKALRAAKIKRAIGKDFSYTNTVGEWQVIYGETRVGGTITFLHTTNTNRDLHVVITIACHEISSIQKVFFDDEEIVFSNKWATHSVRPDGTTNTGFNNKVFMDINYGTSGQSALSSLIIHSGGTWTSTDKQSGRAHVYLMLKWDVTLFPNGLPDISFLVRGKKIYNPITDSTMWEQNAAMIIADFLTDTTYGMGISSSDILYQDEDTLGSVHKAALICYNLIDKVDGTQEQRYQINGSFLSSATPQDTLDEMVTALAGTVLYVNGKWKVYAGAYVSPTLSLNEDNIRGDLTITSKISRRDNFNGIKGTYVNPDNNYEEDDFPVYKNPYYKALDGGFEVLEDIVLPFTQSPSTAQRIAKLELERIRQSITVEGVFDLKAFQVEPCHTLYLSLERMGWNNKIFEVEESELTLESGETEVPFIGVRLRLRETASGVFDWDNGLETRTDLAPNTNLPNPFTVTTPTGLTAESGTNQLYLRGDGTVFTRIKVSWTTMPDYFVSSGGHIEIEHKLSTDSNWNKNTPVSGDSNFLHILDVRDGYTYDIRVRAANSIGNYSSWSSTIQHLVIGKSAPPSDVQGFRGTFDRYSMFLFWNGVTDLDLSHYEIRQGEVGDTFNDAPIIAEVRGTSMQLDVKLAATYRFFIKAVDTSRNYSTNYSYLDIDITKPSQVIISATIEGQNVSISWTESVGFWAIESYELYYGDTFGSAVLLERVKGTSFLKKIDWSGNRRFWVIAKDAAGNSGLEASRDVLITPPGAITSFTSEVVDNNVLLRWSTPSIGTLPLDHYKIYKGAVFSSATLVGQVAGTVTVLFEVVSGTYTYWVKAFDTAGNGGTESGRTAIVNEPPDFILTDDVLIEPTDGIPFNAIQTDTELLIPANNTESVQAHYTSGGWATPQAQVSAGYSRVIQPVPSYGRWEKTTDFGATLDGCLIKFLFTKTDIVGSLVYVVKIAYSLDSVSWTEYEANQVYASNFRYVRVTIEVGTISGVSGSPSGLLLALTHP